MLYNINCLNISKDNKIGDDSIDDSVNSLKKQLFKNYTLKEKKTLAISSFARTDLLQANSIYSSIVPKLGTMYANSLQNEMFQPDIFDLIERQRIDGILKEAVYEQIGLSQGNINSLKLVGAELILLGTLQIREESIRIDARITDISSGKIVSVGTVTIPLTYYIEDLYNDIPGGSRKK